MRSLDFPVASPFTIHVKNTLIAFGYHDRASPRFWTVKKNFEEKGYHIAECHTDQRGLFAKYRDLWKQFRKQKKGIGAVLVTFPGQYIVPLAWLLTRFPRRTLMFDAFLSVHDALVEDRGLVRKWSPRGWMLYGIDWLSCHMADEVLIDTQAHKNHFTRKFHLHPERVRVVYLTAREDLFHPGPRPGMRPTFELFFYGSYIPLQGVEHILDAAAILQSSHPEIRFTLVGKGQTEPAMRKKAEDLHLKNVTFKPTVPMEALPDMIRNADLCLGIFGTTAKAQRVIPHKVYDAVACGVRVLTADTPAIRERFVDGKEVVLCVAGSGEAIAETIQRIRGSR